MKKLIIMLTILLSLVWMAEAQKPFAIKKWKGRYPRMKNDYPFTFVCFKGWLPPIPHLFIRLYPSHYYYYIGALPVSDAIGYKDLMIKHTIRNVFKNIDKKALKKSMEQVGGIHFNQAGQESIEAFLRESRLVVLEDIYDVNQDFIRAREALDSIREFKEWGDVTSLFERELNQHMESFLMISLMDAKQGDKLSAMKEIKTALKELTGTIHYSAQKIGFYQTMQRRNISHLAFLGN